MASYDHFYGISQYSENMGLLILKAKYLITKTRENFLFWKTDRFTPFSNFFEALFSDWFVYRLSLWNVSCNTPKPYLIILIKIKFRAIWIISQSVTLKYVMS